MAHTAREAFGSREVLLDVSSRKFIEGIGAAMDSLRVQKTVWAMHYDRPVVLGRRTNV